MKKIFYIIIIFFIAGCCPRGLTVVENGPLPTSALKFVPYQNDSIYLRWRRFAICVLVERPAKAIYFKE
jgi:hypothetical protein